MHTRRASLSLAALVSGCFTAENTAAPPGDLQNFDPVAHYAAIAAYAGSDARLVELDAVFVRTDGTLDLTADYRPHVSAVFVAGATAEDVQAQGPQAPGSGFAPGDPLTIRLSVRAPGMQHVVSGGSEWDEKHLGMERRPSGPAAKDARLAAPPTCAYKDLWRKALEQGAPADVVANIDYDADGYTFTANGRDFRRRFGADCNLVADKP